MNRQNQSSGLLPLAWALALIAFLFIAGPAHAATFVWTNLAGGNWSNPTNWSPNQVPGQSNSVSSTDDVLINNSGGYTVTFDVADATNFLGVHSIILGGSPDASQQLSIQNGATIQTTKLDITNGATLKNTISTIRGPVTVAAGSLLNSTRGNYYGLVTIAGTAFVGSDTFFQATTINSGALLKVSGGASQLGPMTINGKLELNSGTFFAGGPMTNSGMIVFDNVTGNDLALGNDGTTNLQGGLVNLPNGIINLNNASTFGIQGIDGQEYFINRGVITCTNSGTVNVPMFDNTGGMVTNSSGGLNLGKFTNDFPGTYFAAAGSVIGLGGGTAAAPLALGANAHAFTGPGTFRFASGYLRLTNDMIPNLLLYSGFLEIAPTFQGGAITNLTFDSMYLTNMALPITGVFSNSGSASQMWGNFVVAAGGSMNLSGLVHGTVTVASNGVLNSYAGALNNDCSLTVYGTFNGTPAGANISGPATNYNTINVSGYASFFGRFVNQPGGVVNILTNGNLQGTTLINNGSIVKNSETNTASINITGFTNAGAIRAQNGLLQLNHVTLLPSGSLNVRLNSPTNYGRFSINGAATLTGTFGATLATGYIPGTGNTFQPLTYGSRTGNFTTINLPSWIAWQSTYGSTAFSLLVTQTNVLPAFTSFLSASGSVVFSGSNGTPGKAYWILTGTNLAEPIADWAFVVTNTIQDDGRFSFTNVMDPLSQQQFFILELQ